jgi:HAMP domain-containing protein
MTAVVAWSGNQADDEAFHAIPLLGRGHRERPSPAGNSADREFAANLCRVEAAYSLGGVAGGSGGIVLAILLSSWAAARVTRPVEQLARAAQEVAAGNWNTRVTVSGEDELAQLADSFNQMTAELLGQKNDWCRPNAWRRGGSWPDGWRMN